jgi:hypothetical protein
MLLRGTVFSLLAPFHECFQRPLGGLLHMDVFAFAFRKFAQRRQRAGVLESAERVRRGFAYPALRVLQQWDQCVGVTAGAAVLSCVVQVVLDEGG